MSPGGPMSVMSIRNNLMAVNASRALAGHYSGLSDSVRRLSSGLRVDRAADDAAGLAIRELMRAEIAALHQGTRNANDAISLIQTADGALAIIDEKLIRMTELAQQAATGTYNADQRAMISSEFQAMGHEINRIAHATNFNGIKLLDGTLSGIHDGSGLRSLGDLKVHFGTGNDSAEDYYYIGIGESSLWGLGLGTSGPGHSFGEIPILSEIMPTGSYSGVSGIVSFAVIPAGTTNVRISLNDITQNDSIQLFTRDGKHLIGTTIGLNGTSGNIYPDWGGSNNRIYTEADMNSRVITPENAFLPGAVYDRSILNGIPGGGDPTPFIPGPGYPSTTTPPGWTGHVLNYNGMVFGYSGEGNYPGGPATGSGSPGNNEYVTIDVVTEDLVFIVVGQGSFQMRAEWDFMPTQADLEARSGPPYSTDPIRIHTQELAQHALERIGHAIIAKDKTRAHLGALQNRLENTVANLQIQAENMQASESRISDVDVAQEMTEFVRGQILTSAAVAMLATANSLPDTLLTLLRA